MNRYSNRLLPLLSVDVSIANDHGSFDALLPQILSKLSRVLGVKLKKNPGKK